jgi:hypothetical protein
MPGSATPSESIIRVAIVVITSKLVAIVCAGEATVVDETVVPAVETVR